LYTSELDIYTARLLAAQCIVFSAVCVFLYVFVAGGWLAGGVRYHDNWNLCASMFMKLGQ